MYHHQWGNFLKNKMKLNKPLMHCRLSDMQFFYWDPRIDPREPEYELSQPPSPGGFFCV